MFINFSFGQKNGNFCPDIFFSGAKYPDALQEHPDMTLFTTFILNTGNPYCFDTGMALLIPNFFSVIKKLT